MVSQVRRYLITGAAGQLGSELVRQMGSAALAKSHEALDVNNLEQIREWLPTLRPSAVIHCANYHPRNDSRLERDRCWRTNVIATDNLAKTCAAAGIPLLYVSTSRVFGQDDGHTEPYREDDPVGPVGYLAQTKMAAEHAILRVAQDGRGVSRGFKCWIIRTAQLYERPWRAGHNLAQRLLHEYEAQRPISVPEDVQTNFTYVPHLAQAVKYVVDHPLEVLSGVYHVTNQGSGSLLDFAVALAKFAKRRVEVVPSQRATEDFPRYTVLDSERFREGAGGPALPSWQEALEEFGGELRKAGAR